MSGITLRVSVLHRDAAVRKESQPCRSRAAARWRLPTALGFHMRAASVFVQLSQQFRAEVRVCCNGRAANGRSILDLLTLAAEFGARIEIEATGLDDEEAIAALCALVESGFHEGGDGRMSHSIAESIVGGRGNSIQDFDPESIKDHER